MEINDQQIASDRINNVHEGSMTRAVETQTGKVPSIGYLGLAVGSMVLSATTTLIFNKKELGNFFGLWAPSFMLIGVYNKLVKIESQLERQMLH